MTHCVMRWSTHDMAPNERFDCYASVLADAVTPMSIRSDEPEAFNAEVQSIQLGSISVLRMSGRPHEVSRRESELSRSEVRTFHLLVNLESEMRLSHRGAVRVPAGDAILVDSALGHQLALPEAYDVIHLRLTEGFVSRWLLRPNVLVGKQLHARGGWSAALCAVVRELTPDFVAAAPLPAAVLEDQVGALLALAATSLREPARGELSRRAESALAARIEDCIRDICTNPCVTAQTVAQALSISLRTLHRTLAAGGRTFSELLMSQRVELAKRMLLSSSFKHVTTAEIGRRAGFPDASHFVRVFKRHTGVTPAHGRRGT